MNTKIPSLPCLTVNLSVICKNYHNIKTLVSPNTVVSCVVKSNAYGMGAIEVSKALFEEGCREFYVDDCAEGINLRKSLKKEATIFLFKGIFSGEEEAIYENNLVPVLNNEFQIELVELFAKKKNKKIPCCLHVDTGMTRLGVEIQKIDEIIKSIETKDLLDIKYIISHFACADDNENILNKEQLDKFAELSKRHPKYKYSLANSAGIFLSKNTHFDQVRIGILLYGGVVNLTSRDFVEPAISLTTKIINIYKTEEPVTVGYGATYKTKAGQHVATIASGYFDGIFRCLSNKGLCYVNGKEAHFIGRISMGLISIDLSLVREEDRKIGQEVEIIGKNISLETIAKLADTINYEVLTSLNSINCKKYV